MNIEARRILSRLTPDPDAARHRSEMLEAIYG